MEKTTPEEFKTFKEESKDFLIEVKTGKKHAWIIWELPFGYELKGYAHGRIDGEINSLKSFKNSISNSCGGSYKITKEDIPKAIEIIERNIYDSNNIEKNTKSTSPRYILKTLK